MSSRRIWIAGCAIVMAAAVALGWLLGASPLLDAARVAGEARDAAQAQNAAYRQELSVLKEQFSGIDQLQSDLADLREELPATADQPDYLDSLTVSAQRHNVKLTSITTADAVAYAPTAAEVPVEQAPVADADADAEAVDPAETPSETPADATAPVIEGAGVPVTSPLVTAENFISIPVTLALEGGYGNVLDFVDSVQKGTRLSAVTAYSTSKDGAEVGEGETASADTVTGTVTVLIYVLLDPAAG
jgi:Tfp pilus assembly protein PilO